MPLDAINPLMSALGTLGPAWRMPPVPGGSVTTEDRQQLAGTYAGFAVLAGVTPPVATACLLLAVPGGVLNLGSGGGA